MAVRTAIGTEISAVTAACSSVPRMAWYAPPPSRREVIPRWEFSHQCGSNSSDRPLLRTVHRIHTSGITATRKAATISTVATRLTADRRPDGFASPAGTTGGGAEGWGGGGGV